MICKKCGAELAGDVNFCPRCGAKVEVIRPAPQKVEESACSERSQRMVYMPGRGVYFFHNEQLFLYDSEEQVFTALTDRVRATRLAGLGLSGSSVYYWQECLDERSGEYGMRLIERNVYTDEKHVVWESDGDFFRHFRLDDDLLGARAILYGDCYYLLDYEDQSLMRVSLTDGEQENLPLPDMRENIPLMDWVKPRGFLNLTDKRKNFGAVYTGLDIINDWVYLSLDNCGTCTLRFPLDHPERSQYLPMNTCTAVPMRGMLTSLGERVFSCPGFSIGSKELALYEIRPDGNLIRMLSNANGELNLFNKANYWWRMEDTVYVGQAALQLEERKWHKLPILLFDTAERRDNPFGEVLDFVPGRGGVYLLTRTELYLVPRDWESRAKKGSDLARYRLAALDTL